MGFRLTTFPSTYLVYHWWSVSDGIILAPRGGGVLRNPIRWGVLQTPNVFKMVSGVFLRVFTDAKTPFVRIFLVVLFWTAHAKFCPCPQFSHF